MFVELVDHLRCVRPHEDAWLVLVASRTQARHVMDGTLGCPVCRAEYPLRDGVADFRAGVLEARVAAGATLASGDGEEALRLAALLGLADVQRPVVLGGAWATLASALLGIAPATYLAVNASVTLPGRDEISALRAAGTLPIAAGVVHGIALDAAAAADAGLVAGAVRALRASGRLVAPAALALPDGVRELARDERHWVAERDTVAASRPVPLRRAGG